MEEKMHFVKTRKPEVRQSYKSRKCLVRYPVKKDISFAGDALCCLRDYELPDCGQKQCCFVIYISTEKRLRRWLMTSSVLALIVAASLISERSSSSEVSDRL